MPSLPLASSRRVRPIVAWIGSEYSPTEKGGGNDPSAAPVERVVRPEQTEDVATDAGERHLRQQRGTQALRDRKQQLVALLMAKGVIEFRKWSMSISAMVQPRSPERRWSSTAT